MPRRLIATFLAMAVSLNGCAAHRLLFQPPAKSSEDAAAPLPPVQPKEPQPDLAPVPAALPPGPRPKWVQYDNWLDNHPAFKPVAYGAMATGVAAECTVAVVAPFALLAGCVVAAGHSGGSMSGLSDWQPGSWWPIPPLPGQ